MDSIKPSEVMLNNARRSLLTILPSRADQLAASSVAQSAASASVPDGAGRGGDCGIVLDLDQLLVDARRRHADPDIARVVETIAAGRNWIGVACFSKLDFDRKTELALCELGLWIRPVEEGQPRRLAETVLEQAFRLMRHAAVQELYIAAADDIICALLKGRPDVAGRLHVVRFDWRPVNALVRSGVGLVRLDRTHLDHQREMP